MKYKSLFLIFFLIFLINTIHATITVEVIDKPQITGYSLEGGDLLPNTTYYFAAMYTFGSGLYYAEAVSGVGNMISVTTTDTNKSIRIDWSNLPTGAEVLIRWDTESLQDVNGNWKKFEDYKYTTNSYSGHTGTGVTLTTLPTQNYSGYMSQLEFYVPENDIDLKLNRTKGICKITVTGTENWNNLITAIKASDANDMVVITENSLDLLCSIYGDGTLTIENKQINFLYSWNRNPNITFKNSQISFTNPAQWNNPYGIYENVSFISNSATFIIGYVDISSKNLFLYNTFYSTSYNSFQVPTVFKSTNYFNFRYPEDNEFIKNLLFIDTYVFITPSINNVTNYFRNIEWKNNGLKSYDIRIERGYIPTVADFYQATHINNSKTDRNDKLPLIEYPDFSTYTNIIDINFYINFDLNFNILNNTLPVENAKITLTDVNGTVQEIYTDENGFSTIRLNTGLIRYDPDNVNGLRSKLNNYNPITITVTKDGYETYQTTLTIDEKQTFNINLPRTSFKIGSINHDNKQIKSFSGIINDIRIYDFIKSINYIKTEYLNQINPDNFYTLGPLERSK